MNKRLSKYHPGVNPKKIKMLRDFLIDGRVLDVGCGNGLYGLDCADRGAEVLQLDVADRRDDYAKGLSFIAADVEEYDHADNSIDNIIAFDIVEHLDDDNAFLSKSFKWLRGGRIFISVPNEDNSMLEPLNLAHVHFTDKTHRREYSAESLRELLESNGFNVLHLEPHINTAIVGMPGVLAKNNILSKMIARFYSFQMRVLVKSGLLESQVIADWFLVGEK
jgi:SAM-dependent methyltransferase